MCDWLISGWRALPIRPSRHRLPVEAILNGVHRKPMTTMGRPECYLLHPRLTCLLSVGYAGRFVPFDPNNCGAYLYISQQVHSGKPPFDHLGQAQAMLAIYNGKRPGRSECKRKFSSKIWKIMTQCWNQDPSARPTARDVAAPLEVFAPFKESGNPISDSYLDIPVEGTSRRRSIEDLRSEASSPRFVCAYLMKKKSHLFSLQWPICRWICVTHRTSKPSVNSSTTSEKCSEAAYTVGCSSGSTVGAHGQSSRP